MKLPRVAAITMVYNEPEFLPIWLRYFTAQVGVEHCYVIDHGSDDGSTQKHPGVNFWRLPRSPVDEDERAPLVGSLARFLLTAYDVVIYTDVDEILVADPRFYRTLPEFCAADSTAVLSAHGFDMLHVPELEPAFDEARPVLAQRRWAVFAAALCKTVMVRKPVTWAPGFHCTTDLVSLGALYLFHLRWFDQDIALRRLARTRVQPWANPLAGPWARTPDDEYRQIFADHSRRPRQEDVAFDPERDPLRGLIDRLLVSQLGREKELYRFDLGIRTHEVWRIPDCFAEIF
jgi:hypothetical protein